jgi:DNA-binding beta-propeller fold protein YncE
MTDGSNLNAPWGLAFDQCENLHVADTNTRMIKVFSPQGQYVTQYSSGVSQPAGIAIDDEGNIFITDHSSALHKSKAHQNRGYTSQVPQSNQVCVLDSTYNVIHSFGAPNKNFAYSGITIDKEGYVYVCSMNYHRVQKF